MAIWQYKLFAIPEEEFDTYFKNKKFISAEDFNGIEWWIYRTYKSIDFNSFGNLSLSESWTKKIIMFGDIDSDCVEVLVEGEELCEIAIRVDLRKNYEGMLTSICKFGQDNNLYFLNDRFKVLFPKLQLINQDITDNDAFAEFIARISNDKPD